MKVLALLGTYHRGGVMDRLADLVLEASRRAGAKVEKIHLSDLDIQYCRNCMVCWERPELKVGKCPIEDDVEPVLRKITRCGALLLGTPINYGWPTGVTKVFMERMGPLNRYRGGPGPLGKIPTPRLEKEEGPVRGAAIVTCFGSHFSGLPFGEAEPGFKMLDGMFEMASVGKVQRVPGAWQVLGGFPVESRPLLSRRARKVGEWLAGQAG